MVTLVRALDQAVRGAGAYDPLSLAELGVLGQISRGNSAPTSIARSMSLDPARVTHLTDKLVSLGYLTRDGDPIDRRRCLLGLTREGEGRLHVGRAQLESAMERLLTGMSPEELAGLAGGLEGARRELAVLQSTP
jgi:DNA-binding MarR family transcriptional regulator